MITCSINYYRLVLPVSCFGPALAEPWSLFLLPPPHNHPTVTSVPTSYWRQPSSPCRDERAPCALGESPHAGVLSALLPWAFSLPAGWALSHPTDGDTEAQRAVGPAQGHALHPFAGCAPYRHSPCIWRGEQDSGVHSLRGRRGASLQAGGGLPSGLGLRAALRGVKG